MNPLFVIPALFIFGIFCSYIASQKNRNPIVWFFLGFFFSLIALIAIGVVPSQAAKKHNAGLRKCPSCAEEVKREAKVCRFCQSELPEMIGMTDEQKMHHYKIVVEDDLFVYRNSKKRISKRFQNLNDAIKFAEYCENQ